MKGKAVFYEKQTWLNAIHQFSRIYCFLRTRLFQVANKRWIWSIESVCIWAFNMINCRVNLVGRLQ